MRRHSHMQAQALAGTHSRTQHPLIYPELLRAKNSATAGTREHIALGSSSSSSSSDDFGNETQTHSRSLTESLKCRRNGKVRNNRWIYIYIPGRRRQPSWICVCHTNATRIQAYSHPCAHANQFIVKQSEEKMTFEKKNWACWLHQIYTKRRRDENVFYIRTHTHTRTQFLHMNACLYLNSISSSALHDLFIILFDFVTMGRTKEKIHPTSGKMIWNYEFNIAIFECLHIILRSIDENGNGVNQSNLNPVKLDEEFFRKQRQMQFYIWTTLKIMIITQNRIATKSLGVHA